MCSILCCIEIFPIGSSHLPFGNGTYFISDVAGLDLDFLAQPKLLLGLCHSCFKLQAVYYCLLLGPKSSYFPTPNCVKFEMSMKKNNWLPICSQNLVSEFPIPNFCFPRPGLSVSTFLNLLELNTHSAMHHGLRGGQKCYPGRQIFNTIT